MARADRAQLPDRGCATAVVGHSPICFGAPTRLRGRISARSGGRPAAAGAPRRDRGCADATVARGAHRSRTSSRLVGARTAPNEPSLLLDLLERALGELVLAASADHLPVVEQADE